MRLTVKNNYDLSIEKYIESKFLKIEYADPFILIDKIIDIEEDILKDVKKVKEMMSNL